MAACATEFLRPRYKSVGEAPKQCATEFPFTLWEICWAPLFLYVSVQLNLSFSPYMQRGIGTEDFGKKRFGRGRRS